MSCLNLQGFVVKTSWDCIIKIVGALFAGGTAFFMFISGALFYLIFYKRVFNYKIFLKNKIKKVFLPYLICVIVILTINIKVMQPAHINSDFIIYQGFFYWALWYVPSVMLLFAFSPCFISFIESDPKRRVVVTIIFLLISLFLGRHNTNPVLSATYWTSFYLSGIIAGLYYSELKNASAQFIFNLIAFVTIVTFLLVAANSVYIQDFATWDIDFMKKGLSWATFQKVGLSFVFILIINKLFLGIYRNSMVICFLKYIFDLFAKYSFTIFFYHNLFIIYFINFKISYLNSNEASLTSFLLISIFLSIFICIFVSILGSLLKKVFGKYSRVLIGC